MRKRILLTLTLTLLLTGISFAQSTFGFVEKYGFGSYNGAITSLKTFKGKLYAGMAYDTAQIYRSATGNPASFSKVFDQTDAYTSAGLFTVSNEGPGYMFAAVNARLGMPARLNGSGGDVNVVPGMPSKVVRTTDGTTWEDYYELPIGMMNSVDVSSINMFKGTGLVDSVYISYTDEFNQTYVVRQAVGASDFANSSSWQVVLDLNTQFGVLAKIISSGVFNGKLYYATDDHRLFETTNGTTFTENTNYESSLGNSYPFSPNIVTSMTVHAGELYLAVSNVNGPQLWKTANGVVFDSLFAQPVGFNTIRNLTSSGTKLWMISDAFENFEIGSYAAGSYTPEEVNEFGAYDLETDYNAAMEPFNNHLYVGCEHYWGGGKKGMLNPRGNETQDAGNSQGGQIWRTCLLDTMPIVTIPGDGDTTVCAGASVTLAATAGFVSYLWSNANTSQFLSTNAVGYYTVTATDGNGCMNSADYYISNPSLTDVVFNDSLSAVQLSSVLVCKGSTSPSILAKPEISDYALQVTGLNQGMITPGSSAFSSRQITIELWMKPTSTNYGQVISEYDVNGSWGNDNYDLIEYYGGPIYIELPGVSEFPIGNVPLNQWSHVVLRFDGTTTNGFINGVLSGGSSSGVWELPPSLVDAFKVGYEYQNGGGSGGSFPGFIKDLRIWNSARTDLDIANNMNALTPGTYPDLIYHYMLDEGSGTIANDISGNGNNSVSVTGALVSPQVVTITPAAGTISQGNNYFQFNPLQTTTYTATYTNLMGCEVNTPFVVTVPFVDFTGSFPSVCGSSNAQIYTATAGSYTFTPSVTSFTTNVYAPSPAPSTSTWYVANGFSANGGCAITDSIYIQVGPSFDSNIGNPPPINACEGSNVVLDIQATGGTAPYTFMWQSSQGTDTTTVDTLVFQVGALSDMVYVFASDAIGCVMNNSVSFNIFSTASTDLFGHVSTPPPTVVNVDNGFVYVFKHQPGSAGYDTVAYTPLNANGDYLFTPLTAGNYLIKVMPDAVDFPLGVPTYYGNAFQWDSSLVYTHGCAQTDTADIELVMITPGTPGTASISGYILEGDNFGVARYGNPGTLPNYPFVPGGPLKGIDVKLGKNPGGGIQARVSSDSTGFYEFTAVPDGGYKIFVDIPNLPMDSTREIFINSGDSSIQNNYFADSASIYINPDTINPVGIYSSAKIYENNFTVYPNPAKGDLYISYSLKESAAVAFEIKNVMGQTVKFESYRKHPEGKNIFVFNTDQLNLKAGVYFISLLSDNKKYTQRLVVID